MMSWFRFKKYVPVAQRQAEAAKLVAEQVKNGRKISPVKIVGRAISTTFWGQSWCANLEKYSDYESRLPRGRTYVRNGSVVDLRIGKGRIDAQVSGSELYTIRIDVAPLPPTKWLALKKRSAGRIGSLVELLQGKLSKGVMEQVTDQESGLFPKPQEIKMLCSCPDGVYMCKHLAAVLYGVGHRLDSAPELLFLLRAVDQTELIEEALPAAPPKTKRSAPAIAAKDLGAIFGIEVDDGPAAKPAARGKTATMPTAVKTPAVKAPAVKTPALKKAATVKKTPPRAKKAAVAKKAVAAKKSNSALARTKR
ncbi:MAG: hypothetical protein ACRDD1_08295 [Planctomycetia bacterium]